MTKRTKPTKMSAYIRVSQVRGREGASFVSPDQQREAIQRWASAHGIELEGEYEDLDQSGGKMKRPAFDRMIAAVEDGRSEGVIVAKIDRFARSLIGALKALDHLQELGASFVSVAEGFDTTTPAGRLMQRIMLSLAEFELERIKDNWDDAAARAIGRGIHFTNSVPLGYMRENGNGLVPDPETAPIVREMFQRRAQRESRNKIAAWLNETLPRADGREWTSRHVAAMIQSPAYKGEAFHGEHRNANAHPAIVTLPEWDAANAVKGGPGAIREDSGMLAGIIRCAGCRYAMRRVWVKYRVKSGEERRVETYQCQRKHTGGTCSAPAHVMAHIIEPVVIGHYLAWYGDVEWGGHSEDREAREAAERALADAEARREAFLADDELQSVVGREAFMAEAQRRAEAVDRAEVELAEARAGMQVDDTRRFVAAEEFWQWPHEQQADILRTVIGSVYVGKGHSGRGEALEDRVLIRWAGEDFKELPRRGTTSYKVKPVVWPPDNMLPAANIPEWAFRLGHPALPEDMRELVHDVAREEGVPRFLPPEEGQARVLKDRTRSLRARVAHHPGPADRTEIADEMEDIAEEVRELVHEVAGEEDTP